MQKIYETEKYKGKMNIGYEELFNLADGLDQGECEEGGPVVISYARVSTPKQINGESLERQHKENVMAIRSVCDNAIVFVTEICSGAEDYRKRLLYQLMIGDDNICLVCTNTIDRLVRSITGAREFVRVMGERKIAWMSQREPGEGYAVDFKVDAHDFEKGIEEYRKLERKKSSTQNNTHATEL